MVFLGRGFSDYGGSEVGKSMTRFRNCGSLVGGID